MRWSAGLALELLVFVPLVTIAWQTAGQVRNGYQTAIDPFLVDGAGQSTPHVPADIPANRFSFGSQFEPARFVIVDNLWHNWAMFHVPGLSTLLYEVEGWPEKFSSGQIRVYEKPTTS